MTMPLVDIATRGFTPFAVIMREKVKSWKTFARAEGQSSGVPLKELSRVKLRRLTRKHIQRIPRSLSKLLIIPVQLVYFGMLSNAFRECICKHESKKEIL